ncbi:hypothetical protein AB0B94_30890 [Micromonospora sp. NPDC048986]|uniref:hypothetical protein n=1 Tax=Micromonospora sp. NPDC048986 TaxID=3155644 RepID=UPI0033C2881B
MTALLTTRTEQAIRDLTERAADLVSQVIPDCEGACLGTSAVLAYVLGANGVSTRAVRGQYDEHPHWWLETTTTRIDATRQQFLDGGPLVEPLDSVRDEDPYVWDLSLPSDWTREQAVAEFARMFEYGDVGEQHGHRILAALEDAAKEI